MTAFKCKWTLKKSGSRSQLFPIHFHSQLFYNFPSQLVINRGSKCFLSNFCISLHFPDAQLSNFAMNACNVGEGVQGKKLAEFQPARQTENMKRTSTSGLIAWIVRRYRDPSCRLPPRVMRGSGVNFYRNYLNNSKNAHDDQGGGI